MNNKLLCITCVRDFYKLQRQIESFIFYLPIEYEIIYIIEGENFHEFLKLWDEYSDNHSRLQNKITIQFAHDFITSDTEKYYNTSLSNPFFLSGWHRQQLLKLLAVANQPDDRVIVIDSKDFLFNPLPINIIDSHMYTTRIDPYHLDSYTEHILPIYEEKTGIYLDTKGSFVTPITMIPQVVRTGISRIENFIEWWINTSVTYNWMSEFQLYHLWHVNQNFPLYENKNKKFSMWRGDTPFNNSDSLYDAICFSRNMPDFFWISLGHNASTIWNDEVKDGWSNWLKQNGFIGRWNEIDTNLPEML